MTLLTHVTAGLVEIQGKRHSLCIQCSSTNSLRSVGCYVNNTMDLWGTISWISCCAPFFTLNDNKQAFDYGKSKDINKLGLDWMRTGGSFLVHEMMHTVKITQERPRGKLKQHPWASASITNKC